MRVLCFGEIPFYFMIYWSTETDSRSRTSAPLRSGPDSHEVAYIFGQLSSPYSIPSLLRVMRSPTEDDMVRHEAAEALGGIASEGNPEEDEYDGEGGGLFDSEEDRRKGVLGILREWCTLEEAPVVVRESCQVAVDMWEVSTNHSPFSSCRFGADSDLYGYDGGSTKTPTNSNTPTDSTPRTSPTRPRAKSRSRG